MTREEIIREAIEDYVCNYLTDTEKAQKILNALQDMEQEPCDKCKYFDGNSCQHYDYKVGYTQGYEDASKRFRQEPCDDVVSRDAVLDALLDYWHDIQFVDSNGYDVYEDCKAVIDELPSVTQKGDVKNV